MNRRNSLALASVLLAVCLLPSVRADDTPAQPDQAELEKLYFEFAELAPEHDYFKKFVGRWKAVNKMFMEGAPEPVVSEGTTSFRLLLGGRYLQQKYNSDFMDTPFEGIGISGYDKTKKKYVGVWLDNHSTAMMITEGELDAEGKIMTDVGTASTPMGPAGFKMTHEWKDKNTLISTMYMVGEDGTETKHMEITYTRLPRGKKTR
jgi:hypothetical protein